jgi:multiple sugar transport system substrate-binding protein
LSNRQLNTMPLRSIMYSFGASVQDEAGTVVLGSKQTLEAVRFFKAFYEEAMTKEALYWDSMTCDIADQFIVSGKASLLLSSISVTRTAERENPDMSKKIQLAKTPKGTIQRMGQYYIPAYFIWKFADNIEGAKQFLIDYISNFRKAFTAGKFRDFPCFSNTVPDLKKLIANDSRGHPPTKYNVLEDVLDWTTNIGYPGYTNAAIEEIESAHVIPNMFREAATGAAKPEDAIKDAEAACKEIFNRWREKGCI